MESKQDWEVLMRNFMKEFNSPTKTQSLRNKIDMFVQLPLDMIAEALEHLNEYMRAEFLEWHIDFLKRRMEKMEIERESQDLKAAEARSTCEECEEYDHVKAEINKDVVTKFEDMEKVLENLDGRWERSEALSVKCSS
jgi:hypothetical protein